MKKKNVDFLFVYEIRPRESESIVLLGYELKKRGFSVAYVNTWYCLSWIFKRKINAKVAVIYAAYNTSVVDFALDYVKSFSKVVNLQWEQLLSIGQKDDKTTDYYIQGKAEKVIHFSWGQDNYLRLINDCKLSPDHVKITGHIGMDFLRPEFSGYYLSRAELCEQYHLDRTKKICLFISSFSYVNIPEQYIPYVGNEFVQISNDSQKIVLEWFEKILQQRDDILFVYRPHPAEADNQLLLDMEKRVTNFRVINAYSVKQWIVIADQIYNWYSTSLMEVFSAKKNCFLLRPIKMPERYEIAIFQTAKFIDSYEAFAETIDIKSSFPVSDEEMYKYYYIDQAEPAYIKAANELENVFYNNDYNLPKDFHNPQQIAKRQLLKKLFPFNVLHIVVLHIKKARGSKEAAEELHFNDYAKKLKKQNYISNREINQLMNKMEQCLENGNEGCQEGKVC